MIVTRTPFRISFFGGGTDYPCWYKEHGGAVLAASINKYCWITARHSSPLFGEKFKLVYSKVEVGENLDLIQHPAARECLRLLALDGAEIHHSSDLPARSGMGSSSAFVVGLLHALHKLAEDRDWHLFNLAKEATKVEQEILKENVGDQDQITTARGGFNIVRFFPDKDPAIHPLFYSRVGVGRMLELRQHLMLFFTGVVRTSSDVTKTYLDNIPKKKGVMHRLWEMVDEAVEYLAGDADIEWFGKLLHEAWKLKKKLGGEVTNFAIDAMYEAALKAGAVGGKLLGAGGGGFLLLFVPPAKKEAVRQALTGLVEVPFNFEFDGSVCYELSEPK